MVRVLEFAEPIKDIKDTLKRNRDDCIDHLLKLFYHPECDSKRQWIVTVYKHFIAISRKAGSNKYPDRDFIYKYTIGEYSDDIDVRINNFVDVMNYEYDEVPEVTDYCIDEATSYLNEYFSWLADELSANGKVSINDVRSKISELLTKYDRDGLK